MISRNPQQNGFALLISVIVTSIVLAIGLSILDLTLKELELSTLSKGSEEAFHAANAGVECARYWRNTADQDESGFNDFVEGANVEIECFDGGETEADTIENLPVSDPYNNPANEAQAWRYTFTQDWQSGLDRCSVIDLVVVVAGDGVNEATSPPTSQDDTALVDDNDLPDSYPTDEDFLCPSGGRCTLAFVQGFNAACANINKFGTIQREVLLRF